MRVGLAMNTLYKGSVQLERGMDLRLTYVLSSGHTYARNITSWGQFTRTQVS
ncbi:hypothetical protein GCM10007173_37470 [Glutamicibacter ardleyensis]|uniref:Uncharacterized protein n=1 Tax=Glutamicibacter ardleyensis TaxID=225894 RepID=A0ABQ2DW59_9MICC|nr:hypothetical protein GCM10007173_37470 [Glutamicibacter ardleyensis]